MQIDFSAIDPSDYAAWWGAVIATLALIWNIIVAIRSGARLHVVVSPNMQVYPPSPGQKDKTYIHVSAVNRGDSATTITNFLGYSSDSILGFFSNKHRQHFLVNGTSDSNPIPFKLAPGDEWRGMADQTLMLQGFYKNYFYLGVLDNQSKKPIYKRVRISTE